MGIIKDSAKSNTFCRTTIMKNLLTFNKASRVCFNILAQLLLWGALLFGASLTFAAGQLEQKHLSLGLSCSSCHQDAAPKTAAASTSCESCHGDLKKVSDLTTDIHPNPHVSHQGPFDCLVCHHVHRASEIKCNECHVFEFERKKAVKQ
jgi:fumarate reductase flavoprotein subunit